jgi:predicted nucleic acid-binding protein
VPTYFLDTSALAKRYHEEPGSSLLDGLIAGRGSQRFISRLTIVEFESVLALKQRTRAIEPDMVEQARRLFRADLFAGVIQIMPRRGDFNHILAGRLVMRFGSTEGLRALDALQLSAAMELTAVTSTILVTSDQRLLRVATLVGMQSINPQAPSISLA